MVPTGGIHTKAYGATTMLLRWMSLLQWLWRVWPLTVCNCSRETKHNIINTMHVLIGGHNHWTVPTSMGHMFLEGCQLVYVLVVPTGATSMLLRWTSLKWWLRRVWPLIVCDYSSETKCNITNTMHALIGGHSHWTVPTSMRHMFFQRMSTRVCMC